MANLKKIDRRKPQEDFYCVVCAKAIPPERVIRKAVTCSAAHAKILKLERRRLRDMARCRACNRPSTPEERADFVAWRKARGSKPGPKPQPEEVKEAKKRAKKAAVNPEAAQPTAQ